MVSEFVQHIARLRQEYHNSKSVIFQEKLLKVLKCYTFLGVQQRCNCSPAASFVYCVMTPHLLKVHLQTFLSIQITQKCRILSCGTLVANERCVFRGNPFQTHSQEQSYHPTQQFKQEKYKTKQKNMSKNNKN